MANWTPEQQMAIDTDNSNIIVSAGAGSGKTAVLTERVIRKINDGVHINELLILTFTNAAAKEMKDRIREELINQNKFEELLLIDSAYITTFDSFSLSILKKYHYLLNVSKNINIVDEDLINYKKDKILDDIFNKYYMKKDFKFLTMIDKFCIKNDNDIKSSILKISKKIDLIIDIDKYLDEYMNKKFSEEYLDSVIKDLDEVIRVKINNIRLLLNNISFYVDSDYYEKLSSSLTNLINSNTYEEVKMNLGVSMPNLPRGSEEEVKVLKSSISDIISKDLKKICVKDISELKEEILSTKEYVSVIIDIIKELNNKINEFKYENDLYEFNDIAKMSIKLLKENEYVRNEIKNSLNEIMIDEYQDTNDIQETFISLISDNNVYMVGDIKQSIYRFRNANPYIFKNKYENYSKNIGGIKIDLNKNFRSREETINNINKVFDLIMNSSIGGAEYSSSHRMIFGNTTYNEEGKTNQNNNFEIYNYDYDRESGFTKEEYEIFIIAKDIKTKINSKYLVFDKKKKILRNCTYDDFVILLDTSKDFNLYKKIFEYMNIPLSVLKDEKINDEVIVSVIKNLLVSLVKIKTKVFDEEFKHSFMSILRSFVFEYTDQEIFDLFKNNNFYEDKIYNDLRKINIDSKTIKQIIEELLDKFNVISKISKIGEVEKNLSIIEYIMNYVDTKENVGFTLDDFTNYLGEILDKKYEIKFSGNISVGSSVRIMTIHKSKGLEYSICYYAGLYHQFNIKDTYDKFIFYNKYGIITPYYKEGIGDTIYKYLVSEDYVKEEISEKIRLLYVAFTRAKEKMILVCDLNGEIFAGKDENGVLENNVRLKYKSFLDMIISIKNELGSYITKIEDIPMSKEYELVKKYNFKDYIDESNIKLEVKELEKDNNTISNLSFSIKQNRLLTKEEIDNMEYGTKVHYVFETADFNNTDNELIINFKRVYDFSKSINTYKEYEFMYEEDNNMYHGIIDLMFEYEDYFDIIDYKLSNIDDENYINQLNGYKKYIESITNKKVNVFLYSILKNQMKKI